MGLQLPGGNTAIDFDNILSQEKEIVNTKSALPSKSTKTDQTTTQNFKNWFGDWQNSPETASKIVNANGTPMAVYHQTDADFNIFDVKHKGAGTSDSDTPFGIFLKPTDTDIGLNGKKQIKKSIYIII